MNKKIKVTGEEYSKKMDELMNSKKFKRLFIPEQFGLLLEEASKYEIIDLIINKKNRVNNTK